MNAGMLNGWLLRGNRLLKIVNTMVTIKKNDKNCHFMHIRDSKQSVFCAVIYRQLLEVKAAVMRNCEREYKKQFFNRYVMNSETP